MIVEEFTGIPFAAGVVTGARAFDVDRLGRLTGVTYHQVWRPGPNEAHCVANTFSFLVSSFRLFGETTPSIESMPSARTDVAKKPIAHPEPKFFSREAIFGAFRVGTPVYEVEEVRHRFDRCSCGFYGYYDSSNDYAQPGRVSGVVEGYGEVVIGSRGFRAVKARIIALHIPEKFPARLAQLVARNYDVPFFPTFDAMVGEYACDGGPLAPPAPTPADDDFWTRSA